MNPLNYQNAKFILSVANLDQLPPDEGIEVAFVGRSNAGKSSVLNQLTQNKSLARVSKTPGRTQLINLFRLDETRRLADLPGYGYAKVPTAIKQQWEKLLNDYFHTRQCLKGLILVMDIRHPLKEFDQQMLYFCHEYDIEVHVLLNKCDKLTQSEASKVLRSVKNTITAEYPSVTVQTFSALKGKGVKELREQLDHWL